MPELGQTQTPLYIQSLFREQLKPVMGNDGKLPLHLFPLLGQMLTAKSRRAGKKGRGLGYSTLLIQ